MSEEIYNKKKTNEEQEQLEYLLSKSAKQLPDKPSDYGKTPVDIKKALYEPSQILFDYLLYYYYKNKVVGDELTTKNESVIAYQRLKTDIQSGILTIENYNLNQEKIGESSINLNKANVGFTFEVDHENNRLVINFADGTTQYIDFAELIAQDQFASSATIEVERVNGAYTFNLSDNALRKLIIELSPEELETLITNNEVEHNKLYLVGGSRFSEEEAGTNNVIETLEQLQNRIAQLENKVSSVYSLKGSLETHQDLLNIENPSVGDVYNIIGEGGMNYVYTTNETWAALGAITDLSDYALKSELPSKKYLHAICINGADNNNTQYIYVTLVIQNSSNTPFTRDSLYLWLKNKGLSVHDKCYLASGSFRYSGTRYIVRGLGADNNVSNQFVMYTDSEEKYFKETYYFNDTVIEQ